MQINVKKETKKVEAKFISPSVNIVTSNSSQRIVIGCDRESFIKFKEFVNNVGLGYHNGDIIYTEGYDYLISLSLQSIEDLFTNLVWEIDYNQMESIPSILYTIANDPQYSEIIFSSNFFNVENFKDQLSKNLDHGNYCILTRDELEHLEESDLMKHISICFKFTSDKFTQEMFKSNIEYQRFCTESIKDSFILQEEFNYKPGSLELWKNSCSMALNTYYNYITTIGCDIVAESILPSNFATNFYITASLYNYVILLNNLTDIDEKINLANSSSFLTLIEEFLFFLKDYDYLEKVKESIDELKTSLKSDKLPF